jgi:hypothetical protein
MPGNLIQIVFKLGGESAEKGCSNATTPRSWQNAYAKIKLTAGS